MEEVMVEVLNRFGQVRSRHRLSRFPATLGRALTNDVILDEADVSAVHARVERADDGTLTLVDAKSANGMRVAKRRVSAVVLGASTEVRLAGVWVRFADPSGPVQKTALYRISRLDRARLLPAALGVFAAAVIFDDGYLKATRVRPSELLEVLAGAAIVLCGGWSFIWSLASRVAQGRARMTGHLAASLVALAAFVGVTDLAPYLTSVARLGPAASGVLDNALKFGVAGWLLFQNLSRVVSWSRRRLVLVVTGVMALGAGLVLVGQVAEASKYSTLLPIGGVHLPPALLVGPVPADAALAERIATLRREVDALKREP